MVWRWSGNAPGRQKCTLEAACDAHKARWTNWKLTGNSWRGWDPFGVGFPLPKNPTPKGSKSSEIWCL
jgi:hypothetical protein